VPGCTEKGEVDLAVNRFAKRFFLSARESEVVRLVARGLVSKEIAARLGLAAATVDVYVQRVMHKCGAKDRNGVVALFIDFLARERPSGESY
jgi:DNA-binding NarL/FixJ family response regulator